MPQSYIIEDRKGFIGAVITDYTTPAGAPDLHRIVRVLVKLAARLEESGQAVLARQLGYKAGPYVPD